MFCRMSTNSYLFTFVFSMKGIDITEIISNLLFLFFINVNLQGKITIKKVIDCSITLPSFDIVIGYPSYKIRYVLFAFYTHLQILVLIFIQSSASYFIANLNSCFVGTIILIFFSLSV